jgi:hypothetical protein
MAGDVFFSDNRIWSSNSIGFVDIMKRAIKKCRDSEPLLVNIFSDAEELRSFGINLYEDRNLQAVLTERVLEAARDGLQELNENPMADSDEIKSVEELIGLAEEHLSDLRGDTPVP